jgi:hypothetical protein
VSGVNSPYLLSGLMAGEAIDVQLQSSNAAGTGGWSGVSTLATATATAGPNAPSAVSLAQGAGSDLTVTWSAPAIDSTHSAATGYNLQSSPSGAGTWTIVSGVVSPCDLSGFAGGTAIDVQVQASNTSGSSGWSATTTLTTASTAPVLSEPNVPSGVSLAQGTGSDLTVTWTAPVVDGTHSAATGFNLQSSPSGAGTWTIVSGVTSPYDLSGLAAGAAIDVQLQSSNTTGTSAWSATTTLHHTYHSSSNGARRTERPGDRQRRATAERHHQPAYRHLDRIGGRQRPRRRDRLQPALQPHWRGNMDDGHRCHQPLHARRSERGDGNRRRSPGNQCRDKPGRVVCDNHWHDLGCHRGAGQLVSRGLASVAPNGGVNFTATPAPTAVTGGAFFWSASQTTVPTIGLIAATVDGQPNGWGQWFNTPATAGTFYLWMLAQGAGGVTTGALVTSAIVVS